MQERIQLALILLLFALAGSLEDTSFRSGAESVRPALTQSSVAGSHAAACNYFSAAICPCAVSIEAPAAPSDHKAAVRQLAGARVACDAAFGLRTAMRTYSPALHPDNISMYFTLLVVVILTAIALVAVALGITRAVSPRSYNPQKGEAYECGIPTRGRSWMQFKVGYYLFAILFLMFDVETVFLFSWAVVVQELGVYGLVSILFFLVVLILGLAYAWRKGALEWK